jgi:hypothetical protein
MTHSDPPFFVSFFFLNPFLFFFFSFFFLLPPSVLVHEGRLYMIDVGQAVAASHPFAREFLYRDCQCITLFFQRAGSATVTDARTLFAHVTGIELLDDQVPFFLEKKK